jgi:dihydrofolate synthase/folylpolyglutamate synthase
VILDVAHNPHAAAVLAQNLDAMGYHPTTHAVFAALVDKDIAAVVAAIKNRIDEWHLIPLEGARALPVAGLAAIVQAAGVSHKQIHVYESVAKAYDSAVAQCKVNANEQTDRVVVFGSFMTVAAVMTYKGIKA